MQAEMIETFVSKDDAEILNYVKSKGIESKAQIEEYFNHGLFILIPTIIVESNKLAGNDKLIFGEIIALCRRNGVCNASNEHLAKMCGCAVKTIKRSLERLSECKLINIKAIGKTSGTYRYICLANNPVDNLLNLVDNSSNPVDNFLETRDKLSKTRDKVSKTRDKVSRVTDEENIIEYKEINSSASEDALVPVDNFSKTEQNQQKQAFKGEEVFEEVWSLYPRRLGKKEAFKHFRASVKSEEDAAKLRAAVLNYDEICRRDRIEERYIKHGSTFFNNWRDYIPAVKPVKVTDPNKCVVCKTGNYVETEEHGTRCNNCNASK
jgi:hypothetical protein